MAEPRERIVVTRLKPSPEVGFFVAILYFFPEIRRSLSLKPDFKIFGVPAGALRYSKDLGDSKVADLEKRGYIFFNVGLGRFDEHGQAANRQGSLVCSLEVFRQYRDFLKGRGYLKPLFDLIAGNDRTGSRLSNVRSNIRRALDGLNYLYPTQTKFVLRLISLGFCGAIQLAKNGVVENDPFSRDAVYRGVEAFNPVVLPLFKKYFEMGQSAMDGLWKEAAVDFGTRAAAEVENLSLRRKLRVVSFVSDSREAGRYSRKQGFDVAVIYNRDGHVQIVTSNLCVGGENATTEKKRLDLRTMAADLRTEEAMSRREPVPPMEQLIEIGHLDDEGPNTSSWYLPQFLTAVLNGSEGNREVPKTNLPAKKVWEVVLRALPRCPLFYAPQGV